MHLNLELRPLLSVSLAVFVWIATPCVAQITYSESASAVGLNHTVEYGGTFQSFWPKTYAAALFYMQRNMGTGAAVADYDEDGDLDVYFGAQLDYPNRLLQNQLVETGSLQFIDVAVAAGVDNMGHTRVPLFVDLDNNGLLDLVLANDSVTGGSFPPSAIYRNEGDGTFEDVTAGSGFTPIGHIKGGMGVTDYDEDGLLDIYVTNWSGTFTGDLLEGQNYMFRNLGGFLFEDATAATGLGIKSNSFTPIFADFDNDGDSDLFQAVDGLADYYYRNDGGGQFVDQSVETHSIHVGTDMGVSVLDFDRDGDLDLFATNVTDPFGYWGGNALQVNSFSTGGSTYFTDQGWAKGVANTGWGWGTEWVDCDNDGIHELFAVNGFDEWIASGGAFPSPMPPGTEEMLMGVRSFLFGQIGGGQYAELVGAGASVVGDARAAVAFDADRDGDIDLLITNINQPAHFLLNQTTNSNHWLDLELEGTTSNRNGIGARVRVTAGNEVYFQDMIGGASYLAGRPFELHFGLGAATVADEVRVFWPDGRQTVVEDVAADQLITVQQEPDPGDFPIHDTLGRPGSAGFAGTGVTQDTGSWRAAMTKLTMPAGDVTLTDLDLIVGTAASLSKAEVTGLQVDLFSSFTIAMDQADQGLSLNGDLYHLDIAITPDDLVDWTIANAIDSILPQYYYRLSGIDVDLDADQEVWVATQWTGPCALASGCMGVPVTTIDGEAWRLLSPDLAGDHWNELPSLSLNAWVVPNDCSAMTLPAAEVVRAGSPPNPYAFLPGLTSGPVIGAVWDPVIDHSTFMPSSLLDIVVISAAPTQIPLEFGTLLCDISELPITYTSNPGVPFAIPIPNDCNFVGATPCTQGASVDLLGIQLANALDITVGTF